jgi:hypothetical protein
MNGAPPPYMVANSRAKCRNLGSESNLLSYWLGSNLQETFGAFRTLVPIFPKMQRRIAQRRHSDDPADIAPKNR